MFASPLVNAAVVLALVGLAVAVTLLAQPDLLRRTAGRAFVAGLFVAAAAFLYALGREVDRLDAERTAVRAETERKEAAAAREARLARQRAGVSDEPAADAGFVNAVGVVP